MFANTMLEERMRDKNWFMRSPHNNWMASIVSLVRWHAQHGRNYSEIMKVVPNYEPLSGWDDETKQFVKLAAKIATSEDDGL